MRLLVNHKSRNSLILFIVALMVGYILSYQFNLQKRINKISSDNEDANLAVEVASLVNANESAQIQLDELTAQLQKLNATSNASNTALQNMESDIDKYLIFTGKSDVEGPGVVINIDDNMFQTQTVDFINALRNIGYEAMSINDRRILSNSGVSGNLNKPIVIKVIGDTELLKNGLDRTGGIFNQTGINASVTAEKSIKIKAN